MTTWYSKDLGDGVLAGSALDEIERSVKAAAEGGHKGVAAFTRHVSGDLHCSVMLYLTPMAASIAGEFGADPCASPTRPGLTLLAGSEEAWELL